MTTPEPTQHVHSADDATAPYAGSPSLEDLMAEVAPLDPREHFDIPDLTNEDWEAFERALAE